MPLNIKDPVTDRLARRLAELTGTSLTVAIREALEARLDWVEGGSGIAEGSLSPEMSEILASAVAHRPTGRGYSDEEILGFDEAGLPA